MGGDEYFNALISKRRRHINKVGPRFWKSVLGRKQAEVGSLGQNHRYSHSPKAYGAWVIIHRQVLLAQLKFRKTQNKKWPQGHLAYAYSRLFEAEWLFNQLSKEECHDLNIISHDQFLNQLHRSYPERMEKIEAKADRGWGSPCSSAYRIDAKFSKDPVFPTIYPSKMA